LVIFVSFCFYLNNFSIVCMQLCLPMRILCGGDSLCYFLVSHTI